jgi:hypothetical protein
VASITNSTEADGLVVSTTSKAARAELFDAMGNKLSRLNGGPGLLTDEAVVVAGLNDGNVRHLRTDRLGSLAVALNTVLLTEPFEGVNFPAARWTASAVGMAATQTAAAGLLLNSGNITAASNGYLLRSIRSFAKVQRAPLQIKIRARAVPVANAVIEVGFGDVSSSTGAHTNGAYWQYTAGGVAQPILTFNGSSIAGTLVLNLNPANYYVFDVILDDDSAFFSIQDTNTGVTVAEQTIFLPTTQPKLWGASRIFAFSRVYNTVSVPASAPSLIVASIDCLMLDATTNKPWREQMSESGYGAGLNPTTFAQTINWANSAAPTSATLSNTTAGYTTLGGLFQFAAVAGSTTDYVLFGFQSSTPYSFVLTGIDIEAWNTGAAVATTPTLMAWGLAYDLSAVSLTTAGARLGVGSQDLPIGAAIGARALSISKEFSTPIITNPGRFLDLILRMPVATATASQIIQGQVNFRGYFN